MKAPCKHFPPGQRHAKPTQSAARLSDERRNSRRHHLAFLDSVISNLEELAADPQRAAALAAVITAQKNTP